MSTTAQQSLLASVPIKARRDLVFLVRIGEDEGVHVCGQASRGGGVDASDMMEDAKLSKKK